MDDETRDDIEALFDWAEEFPTKRGITEPRADLLDRVARTLQQLSKENADLKSYIKEHK